MLVFAYDVSVISLGCESLIDKVVILMALEVS